MPIPVNKSNIDFLMSDTTLKIVSRESGVESSHVWRIMQGGRVPSVVTFHKLAQYFGLTMDELYELMYEVGKPTRNRGAMARQSRRV
jgi:transcriptional regulator with XRE-family HTH domain